MTRRRNWLGDRVRHQEQQGDERPKKPRPAEDGDTRPCVGWVPIRCPYCRSTHKSTNGVNGTLRYHQCKNCQRKFNSIETGADADEHVLEE